MIQQCLHGYAKGHSLLATSISLSREQRTLLSQMTDLTGPAPVQGFDGYLSGFPLPGDLYALSKTWYATELPRPGCVWTHSLLLTPDEISRGHLGALTTLFRRPPSAAIFENYDKPLVTPEPIRCHDLASDDELASILRRLYGLPKHRICVVTESTQDVEATFLTIWDQQWPSLRREFAFTTGLLGSGPRIYALQAIPYSQRRLFQDSASFSIFDYAPEAQVEGWVRLASLDAVSDGTPLRAFLWRVGDCFDDGRAAFVGLCEVFTALVMLPPRLRAHATYERILANFGQQPSARRLAEVIWEARIGLDEVAALEILIVDAGAHRIVDISLDKLRERARTLSPSQLRDLVTRLAQEPDSDRLEEIRNVYYDKCSSQEVAKLPPAMAAKAITRNQELATDGSIWQRPETESLEVIGTLVKANTFTKAIALGLLRHGSSPLLSAGAIGPTWAWIEASREFVDSLGTLPATEPIERFLLGRLRIDPWSVSEHLRQRQYGSFVKLAAAVMSIDRETIAMFPVGNAAFEYELPLLRNVNEELHACGFLLAVGLSRDEELASRFLCAGFDSIYVAAREQRLPWEVWSRLTPMLPWYFLEWDYCVRLVEGATKRFVNNSWPASSFFMTFRQDEAFNLALSVLTRMGRGDIVSSLRSAARDQLNLTTPSQRDRLQRFAQMGSR